MKYTNRNKIVTEDQKLQTVRRREKRVYGQERERRGESGGCKV